MFSMTSFLKRENKFLTWLFSFDETNKTVNKY